MQVSKMMHTDVTTVPPDMEFPDLFRLLACSPMRPVYVVGAGGTFLGMVTSRELFAAMSPFYVDANLVKALADDVSFIEHAYRANSHKKASDVMNRDRTRLKPTDHFVEAEVLLREYGGNFLPVVDEEGRLVGEITLRAILKYIARTVLGIDCPGKEG